MYLEVLGGSSGVLGRSLDVPQGVVGGAWGSLGGPRGSVGLFSEAPKTDEVFLGVSREGSGRLLEWFWCSGVVLGSDLGVENVAILLILVIF